MLKKDTLNSGPSKLLLKEWDMENYSVHRKNIKEIKGQNKDQSKGEHIHPINLGGYYHKKMEREREIDVANRNLLDKIKGIAFRKGFETARTNEKFVSTTKNGNIIMKKSKSPIARVRIFNGPFID